jgi:hypothetical protein
MLYLYPFGRSNAESIHIYGYKCPDDFMNMFRGNKKELLPLLDSNYTLFFDQEPIDLAIHSETFSQAVAQNHDINIPWRIQLRLDEPGISHEEWVSRTPPATGILVTSEKDSDSVKKLCQQYNWKSAYYFFHGWAALDWYRGYNHTFLMPDPKDRRITRTFIMPNRIIAGERKHRLIMLYHIFKYGMTSNHISCPAVCPAENISINDAIKDLFNIYPDFKEVFDTQSFPMCFAGESDAPMHSYQLSLFDECAESLIYLVTETVATGRRLHLTEKTFKPICMRMPFMIVGTQGSLKYLRSYGFKTFGHLWDESYDDEIHDDQRIEKIAFTLRAMDILPPHEKQRLFDMAQEICEYNYNHFYNGGFESILWDELTRMLNELKTV